MPDFGWINIELYVDKREDCGQVSKPVWVHWIHGHSIIEHVPDPFLEACQWFFSEMEHSHWKCMQVSVSSVWTLLYVFPANQFYSVTFKHIRHSIHLWNERQGDANDRNRHDKTDPECIGNKESGTLSLETCFCKLVWQAGYLTREWHFAITGTISSYDVMKCHYWANTPNMCKCHYKICG